MATCFKFSNSAYFLIFTLLSSPNESIKILPVEDLAMVRVMDFLLNMFYSI